MEEKVFNCLFSKADFFLSFVPINTISEENINTINTIIIKQFVMLYLLAESIIKSENR